ncbi:MAG: fumarate reductase flavoprotein subunit, partial [Betaproteobacteria bacterium]|nr:fumarate reductase flavoprotein subunit [Betaproteobacteria bacterium]
MNVVYTDVLVIGGGLAGLRMAVAAKRRGHDAIILSLVPPKRSHSKAAQGGMQASLGNVIKGQGDNEDVHFEDTVRGSDWGADQEVVRMFVNTAPKAVRELAAWGVPWSRVRKGDRQVVINGQKVTITERDEAHGLVAQRDFGGTKKWRTCYVADATGHAMLQAVGDQAIAASIPVHERTEALALIHEAGRCYGAVVRDLITGELTAYVAKATALATGGAGRLYRVTTNAVICEGIGTAIALETGVATIGNMEAVQFHPTPIFPAGILLTEGCRGDGGLLLDVDGHRFMPDYEPEKKELASRDVVSRRMEEHIKKGKGAQSRFGEHIWLDIRLLGEKHIKHNLREVWDICHYFLGLDPVKDLIPVRPAQHYTMGGVRTRPTGESPTLKGLFAAGEAACWDMHGFNRLGGNSVAETVVAGMIVGEFIADFCDKSENDVSIPTGVLRDFVSAEQAKLQGIILGKGTEDASALKSRMQEIMSDKVGIFRTGKDLEQAVDELQKLLVKSRNIGLKSR